MKAIALSTGILALVGTIVPPLLVLTGQMAPDPMKTTMLVSCIVWFVTAPMWMKSE
jgi:hypothetical protein